jgi:hypothetical protein
MYRCPCCCCRTLTERAGFEICPVCYWEDDGQDCHDADEVRGGPNGSLSLTQARENFRRIGATDARFVSNVRRPLPEELCG